MESPRLDINKISSKRRWKILKYAFCISNILGLSNINIWKNVKISKYAVIRGNVSIGNWSFIDSRAVIENSTIWENCNIWCEVKNSTIWNNVNSKHPNTNILNATIQDNCNIGAWVVFANYDWNKKWEFKVEEWSFIWSNCTIILKSEKGKVRYIAKDSYIPAWTKLKKDVLSEWSLVLQDKHWYIYELQEWAYKYIRK